MSLAIGRRRRRSRWLIAAGVVAIAVAGAIVNWAALGGRAKGARLRRMQKSPEWQGSHFENPQPIVNPAISAEYCSRGTFALCRAFALGATGYMAGPLDHSA